MEETGENDRLHFFTNYGQLAVELEKIGIFTNENVNEIKHSITEKVASTMFNALYTGGRKRTKRKTIKKRSKKRKSYRKRKSTTRG